MSEQVLGLPPELLYALAVILASLLGLIGHVIYRWLDTKRSRKTLQDALQAEMATMSWLTEKDLSSLQESIKQGKPLTTTYIPTNVYDSNIDDIGLLAPEKAEAVIKYYDTAHIAKGQMNAISDSENAEPEIRRVLADRTIPKLVDNYTAARVALQD